MAVHTLEEILVQHPFLHGLEPEHLETITGCASNRVFDPNEFLCREGADANAFYLIREGTVAVELQTPHYRVRVTTVGDGDILGWGWMIEPYRWRFDACAVTPVRAFQFDAACLRRKMHTDHELGYHLLRRFSVIMQQRMEAMCLQVADMYGKPSRK